jgi:hypothetical protein
MRYLLAVLFILTSVLSSKSEATSVKSLVTQYYLQVNHPLSRHSCENSGACIDVACAHISCSYKSDALEVAKACAGNYSDTCLRAACTQVDCAYKSDVLELANACKAVDGSCVKAICGQTSCNYKSDLLDAIHSCGSY